MSRYFLLPPRESQGSEPIHNGFRPPSRSTSKLNSPYSIREAHCSLSAKACDAMGNAMACSRLHTIQCISLHLYLKASSLGLITPITFFLFFSRRSTGHLKHVKILLSVCFTTCMFGAILLQPVSLLAHGSVDLVATDRSIYWTL